jgi:hypothetical protein
LPERPFKAKSPKRWPTYRRRSIAIGKGDDKTVTSLIDVSAGAFLIKSVAAVSRRCITFKGVEIGAFPKPKAIPSVVIRCIVS